MYSINTKNNKTFKALSYKTRTDILQKISKRSDFFLTDLSKELKMSKQTLEFHLKILKDLDIIKSKRKDGRVLLSYNKKQIAETFKNFIDAMK